MTVTSYELPYCTVTGTFVAVDADSVDEDAFPDVQPLNGTITLTPTTNAGRVDDAFAQILPVTVRVFGGQIVDDQDVPGARILATDANIGVADWAWRASFNLEGITLDPLTFKAPRDTTVNLTSGLVPIKSQPYQIIEGASIVDAEVSGEGTMRFELSDGTFTRWIDIPNGEQGIQGERGEKGDPGKDGVSATITMGSVTAGATADMWMTGTPQARELHAVLPRGLKGDRGDRGDRGEQGERGPAGQSVTRTAPGAFSITGGGVPAWDDITGKPDAYAPTEHQHPVSDVQGLAARLAALEYDSGWRALCRWSGGQVTEGTLPTGLGPRGNASGGVFVRRYPNTVSVAIVEANVTASSPTVTLPSGFRGSQGIPYPAVPIYYRDANLNAALANAEFGSGFVRYRDVPAGATLSSAGAGGYGVTVTVPSESSRPATLPGTPA